MGGDTILNIVLECSTVSVVFFFNALDSKGVTEGFNYFYTDG